jgi:hypothetical protein
LEGFFPIFVVFAGFDPSKANPTNAESVFDSVVSNQYVSTTLGKRRRAESSFVHFERIGDKER